MAMAIITDSFTFQVTDIIKEQFALWARNKYNTYHDFLMDAYTSSKKLNSPIDRYIRSNILPIEMKCAWHESESYIDITSSNTHIKQIILCRERIIQQIQHMKKILGEYTFQHEIKSNKNHLRLHYKN